MQGLCGDETAALVGDLGASTFKFGFAGEDCPKGWIPSCVGRGEGGTLRLGDASLRAKCKSGVEIAWAREDGKVKDWDAVEQLWTHALQVGLSSDPKEHPVLAACATNEPAADRAKLAQILFETLQVPALFLARNAMLTAFSLGRASALVVDIGASKTVTAAVQDGFVMNKSIRTSSIAGNVMDDHLIGILEKVVLPQMQRGNENATEQVTIQPILVPAQVSKRQENDQFVPLLKNGNVLTASFIDFEKRALMADVKANACRVWSELGFDESRAAVYAKERYELPDGTVIYLGPERFKSGELLVHPETFFPAGKESSVQSLIRETIQSLHVDLRRELLQQMILVGGGSLLPGTVERITKELALILPSALKPRFLTPTKNERIFSVFTGGSILATLGSFQQLWVSNAEYAEHGADIVAARCVH